MKEELATIPESEYTTQQGAAMPVTQRAMNEAVRLTQGGLFARSVMTNDFELDGYYLPKDIAFSTLPVLTVSFLLP